MNKERLNKTIGCIFIVVSSIVGAGMLALPLVGAKLGFGPSVAVLCLLWLILLYSSSCILELALALPRFKNSFYSMAKMTLGPVGKLLVNASFLLLLYSILGAYIAGGGSMLAVLCKEVIPASYSSLLYILFTIILGFFIFLSTRTVDYLLRGLMSLKGFFLVLALALLLPLLNADLLKEIRINQDLVLTLPIFLVALAYNVIIPTLVNYVGDEPKLLLKSIIIGSLIALILFIGWIAVTLGIIPFNGHPGLKEIIDHNESTGGLMLALRARIDQPLIYHSFDLFSNIALWASFLAIGLALFDYIADVFKRDNQPSGRLQTSIISFLPPLIFALIYPQGFIYALNFTGMAICVLQLLLPPIMIYKLRAQSIKASYQAPFGHVGLCCLFGCGLVLFVISSINIVL